MADRTEAEAVADLVKETQSLPRVVEVKSPDGRSAVVLVTESIDDNGSTKQKVESVKKYVDEYRSAPERRSGTAVLGDLDSFIAHAKRFADEGSALFANNDKSSPSLVSVLDYHPAGAKSEPRFGTHRGAYNFPLSDEWREWNNKNGPGNAFGQGPFAEFIENRILDILDPATAGETARTFVQAIGCTLATPSKLMELSRGLSIRVGAKLQQAVNLGTGEVQLQFVSEHQDEKGAPLKIPGAFVIAIPVFEGGPLYQLPVRLRYRVRDGGSTVVWHYELARVDEVFDHAFTEACTKAKTETGLPLFVGKPE